MKAHVEKVDDLSWNKSYIFSQSNLQFYIIKKLHLLIPY